MKLLITGSARSGTKWMSDVLRSQGLDIRHESEGADGTVSWCLAAPTDGELPVWHGQVPNYGWSLVMHQVRHPLHAIASLTTVRAHSFEWASRHVDINLGWAPRKLALGYWVKWNLLAETRATVRFRVEDVTSDIERSNRRPHGMLSWAELNATDSDLAAEARDMASRYGYEVTA